MIYFRQHKKEKSLARSGHYGKLLLSLVLALALAACGSSSGGGGDDPAPAAGTVSSPENVSVTASDASATVAWDDVAGATSYNVYWKNTPDVSKTSYAGVISEDVSPCDFANLTNGDTYYFVVTAVGPDGEGPESLMVGAMPRQPLSAPQFVSAQPTPDTTNSITISWPDVIGATSYNIYWDVIPGVTKNTGTRIQFVQAPYVHTGIPGQATYYYVVTAVDDTLVPVEESDDSAEVSATARGPKTPVGGHDEGFGNNLSVPVVFANGYGMTGLKIDGTVAPELDHATGLRPTDADITRLASLGEPFPYFDPTKTISIGGVEYFTQSTTSTWQADWADGSGAIQNVTAHWGDNLVSAPLRTTQMIRVETVLTQDNTVDNMEGFYMQSLYGTMRNEVFGTDGLPGYLYPDRMVFAPNARLKIEQLDAPGGNPVGAPYFDKALYESFGVEGPGGYGSEINGKGSLTYGYNWKATAAGAWRLTFSLDTDCGLVIPNCDNTVIDSVTNGTLISDHAVQIEVTVQ
jgi:hypothetical protein